MKVSRLVATAAAACIAVAAVQPVHAASGTAYPWQLPLSDQDGGRFDLRDYRGKTLLLGFMFTRCPVACPMQTAKMAKVQDVLSAELKGRSRFLSISIDPTRDTPAQLAAYAKAFGADLTHWRFGLTQDDAALKRLIDALAVNVKTREDGTLEHKMVVFLIDASGRVVQRYVGDQMDVTRVANELAAVDRLLGVK
jgi:protein SCO1/2